MLLRCTQSARIRHLSSFARRSFSTQAAPATASSSGQEAWGRVAILVGVGGVTALSIGSQLKDEALNETVLYKKTEIGKAPTAIIRSSKVEQSTEAHANPSSSPTTTASATDPTLQQTMSPVPLIPRTVLFGNPSKAGPDISPDGKSVAFIQPDDKDVLNVYVAPVGNINDAVKVTNDSYRGIRDFFWGRNSNDLFYLQDAGGDENFHLYSVNLETMESRELTPFDGVRVGSLWTSRDKPDELLLTMNQRDKSAFDVHRLKISTGELTMEAQNPGDVVSWIPDKEFRVRGANHMIAETGETVLRVKRLGSHVWKEIERWGFDESGGGTHFNFTGERIFVRSTNGSDTQRIALFDTATAKELGTVAEDHRCDAGSTLMHPHERYVQAVCFEHTTPEWKVMDEELLPHFDFLKSQFPCFEIVSRDDSLSKWVIRSHDSDKPVSYSLYDTHSKKLIQLFETRPELKQYKLSHTKPIIINSRDGLELVSYLTLPAVKDPKNLPLVLFVHGGPWARDSYDFNPACQWFANRGYACLQVNFRGSSGFGKGFLNKGNKEWGHKMQDDLTDAVQWAIDEGLVDKDRVAIFGGSYGGYAALAGITFTPDVYRCSVDIVGPSNLRTLLQTVPPYWKPMKKKLIDRIGDVEADDELNQKLSPVFHVDKIKVPLLIGQGANDPRVKQDESDQIVKAMRAKKIPVTYILYSDEGHGFRRPPNRLDFYGRVEEFLCHNLGGRLEPLTNIEGTTAESK